MIGRAVGDFLTGRGSADDDGTILAVRCAAGPRELAAGGWWEQQVI